jgi:alpha-mannosidase
MAKPTVHLICNAHLDPVWQWRWEEGASEALSTFGNAVRILNEHPSLIFNHNEAILYKWVLQYDPSLFRHIQKLVRRRRWHISGGWFIQPDVNLPSMESIYRHILEGRRFFAEHFHARPEVAYNFDSFGHGAGLPQVLKQTGHRMYIHMRPQESELHLPSDLYRWRGVDGSEILTYRIAVGLYHTERDNIAERLARGIELALRLKRDVPVFWGIGNHGGGATREDLEVIDAHMKSETRVHIRHSTPEKLYRSLRRHARKAPVVTGDLQRVFTGCYTSLSRLKRRALSSTAGLVQAEALATAAWWLKKNPYPEQELRQAWEHVLFNDFHDILPGSCTEPAERDALDLYGAVDTSARSIRLGAVAALNRGAHAPLYIPVTVANTNPSLSRVPVDVECMLNLRPKWSGTWHLRLTDLNGREIPHQEEQPESLLPFNGWRRKISFVADLPQTGIARYALHIHEGTRDVIACIPKLPHAMDPASGLMRSLWTADGRECLAGPLMVPLVVEDEGDAWGADCWNYRNVIGAFTPQTSPGRLLHDGPVRRITESSFAFGSSTATLLTIVYPDWPVVEYHWRVHWHEKRRRLKLSIPTAFNTPALLCEVPGGMLERPGDADEHVHGRWCMASGLIQGKATALGVVNSGQHGLDFQNGEIRLSVLRSAAYCHEKGFALTDPPARKYMDQGIHEFRLLVTVGDPEDVRAILPGLSDWLASPPAVYAHLPIGNTPEKRRPAGALPQFDEWFTLHPSTLRVMAFKQSEDHKSLLVRLQETTGRSTAATLSIATRTRPIRLQFRPLEIKTLRIRKRGAWREVDPLEDV